MSLKNRSFLKLLDYTPAEIEELLDLAADLKAKKKAGIRHNEQLAGKNIALIFEKTSTRTRCSFEVAAHDLGMEVTVSIAADGAAEMNSNGEVERFQCAVQDGALTAGAKTLTLQEGMLQLSEDSAAMLMSREKPEAAAEAPAPVDETATLEAILPADFSQCAVNCSMKPLPLFGSVSRPSIKQWMNVLSILYSLAMSQSLKR